MPRRFYCWVFPQPVIATAKANGLKPMAWLKETFEKLPGMSNKNIDELLPFKKIQSPE